MLQLDLLHQNVWILKPVAGAHGQGIAFVTGLCAETGDPVQTTRSSKVSFKRRGLGDDLGFVLGLFTPLKGGALVDHTQTQLCVRVAVPRPHPPSSPALPVSRTYTSRKRFLI